MLGLVLKPWIPFGFFYNKARTLIRIILLSSHLCFFCNFSTSQALRMHLNNYMFCYLQTYNALHQIVAFTSVCYLLLCDHGFPTLIHIETKDYTTSCNQNKTMNMKQSNEWGSVKLDSCSNATCFFNAELQAVTFLFRLNTTTQHTCRAFADDQ